MWILPTMSRPEQCAAVVRGAKGSEIFVFINGTEYYTEYCKALSIPEGRIPGYEGNVFNNIRVHCNADNIGALGALNKIFEAYPNEKFYGFIGDDEFLIDPPADWDQRLIDAAGDWDFSHGYDNIHKGTRAQGYLCIGGKLARAVGYLAIPECWHWFGLDDMWEALARMKACRNILVPEVRIEHRHPAVTNKSDTCYELGASNRDVDEQHFLHWVRHKMPDAIARIKEAKA